MKKILKKLTLRKVSIAELTPNEAAAVKGGETNPQVSCIPGCPTATCICSQTCHCGTGDPWYDTCQSEFLPTGCTLPV